MRATAGPKKKKKKRRSPKALYSNKAPNWARGTINKCGRQFRNISRYNLTYDVLRTLLKGPKGHHVGDTTLLLDYIIRCDV
jgi:hypothetical protein